MKRITERTEIAKALNFGKYPVIKIDLSDRDDYGIRGTKVNIDFGGEYYERATIRAFNDEGVLTTHAGVCGLSASLSYDDYMEMAEYANAPVIKANQEIVIFLYNSLSKMVYAPAIIKTGERISRHCMTPLKLEAFKVI